MKHNNSANKRLRQTIPSRYVLFLQTTDFFLSDGQSCVNSE